MPEPFIAKTGEFAGPMEILLRLVEERKLHISQVSLAAVADDFIAYLTDLETSSPSGDSVAKRNETANFILVASTLMLIKSLSLLPTLAVTPEEKEGIEDLERRLQLYQEVRELSGGFKERFGRQIIFNRESPRAVVSVFAPTVEITLANLLTVAKNLIANFPRPEVLPQVVLKKIITLEEAIGRLADRVRTALNLSFRQFVSAGGGSAFGGGNPAEKVNIIVSFLGLLELVKRGAITAEQSAHFEDIRMESGEAGTPHYL